MISWKKATVSLAAVSMVASPVVASAAPRAASVVDGQNDLEGASWVAVLFGLAIIAGGVWLAVDGDDDPVSP